MHNNLERLKNVIVMSRRQAHVSQIFSILITYWHAFA